MGKVVEWGKDDIDPIKLSGSMTFDPSITKYKAKLDKAQELMAELDKKMSEPLPHSHQQKEELLDLISRAASAFAELALVIATS